ncbi:MAG: ATP-grasp domain-containing protein [Planctomycetia bacterium]|nr:ATP-grasp domain-containing protein [Planctomycetia bacterium]
MKLFLYEHITGGGLLGADFAEPLPPSLLAEGRAMIEAVAADFSNIPGAEVTLLAEPRAGISAPGCRVIEVRDVAEAESAFDRLAGESDWTLVIAPELEGALLDRCRRVEQCGSRLLGPGPKLVELASDKHAMAEHLAKQLAGHATEGIALEPGQRLPVVFPYPAVLKPRDGAGSQDVRLVPTADDAAGWPPVKFPARLERFRAGIAASVAVLCGPAGIHALPPCRQHLSDDGQFRYLGGSLPLEPGLSERATYLALAAVQTLPSPQGYIGVDLVLGQVGHEDDVVIEINPRLTTSYVGLRAASIGNLAEAMLNIAQGHPASLSFRPETLQFAAGCRLSAVSYQPEIKNQPPATDN